MDARKEAIIAKILTKPESELEDDPDFFYLRDEMGGMFNKNKTKFFKVIFDDGRRPNYDYINIQTQEDQRLRNLYNDLTFDTILYNPLDLFKIVKDRKNKAKLEAMEEARSEGKTASEIESIEMAYDGTDGDVDRYMYNLEYTNYHSNLTDGEDILTEEELKQMREMYIKLFEERREKDLEEYDYRDVDVVEINGINYLYDELDGTYWKDKGRLGGGMRDGGEEVLIPLEGESESEAAARLEKRNEEDLEKVQAIGRSNAEILYNRIIQEEKNALRRIELDREREADRQAIVDKKLEEERLVREQLETESFRRKMVLQSRGTTEEKEEAKLNKWREEHDAMNRLQQAQVAAEREIANTKHAKRIIKRDFLEARRREAEGESPSDDGGADEPSPEELANINSLGYEDKYSIFLRAKQWKPYPVARAKKGEKGRADYKKEGRVGFLDDFPEVPYWQGQLGLVLYMDKVDIYEGKKKKRKKVARDRLTDRIYLYNSEKTMYEEQTQSNGFPDATLSALTIFNNKICLAEQMGLNLLKDYYTLPEGLQDLNYYIEEEYDDLFDCNCNHLGKFSGATMKIVGQANRYDWVKSEVEFSMFLAREMINTILMELSNQLEPDYDEEQLLEYEKQYAEGIQGKGNNTFGAETSSLVAYQASPTAVIIHDDDAATQGQEFGDMGYQDIRLIDVRTEEEKLIKYFPEMGEDEDEEEYFTYLEDVFLFKETNKIPAETPAPAPKPKVKITPKPKVKITPKPPAPKKPKVKITPKPPAKPKAAPAPKKPKVKITPKPAKPKPKKPEE